MRQLLTLGALVALALALLTAGAGKSLAAATGAPSITPGARMCTPATIGGRSVCLQSGEFCSPQYESQYNAYGYTCRRASDGRNRLYTYSTPPTGGPTQKLLTLYEAGAGAVTSSPTGISCTPICAANFNDGTVVTLSEVPAP